MTGRLRGKVAIVAGAGSIGPGWGNGKATATVFAREGAKVVCADVNLNAAEETAAIIENEGGEAFAVRTDVTRAEQVADLVDRTLGRYGRIDILDNNVGIAEVGSVVDLSEETWEKVFRVNLTGAFLAMKHVIPVMQRQFEETGRAARSSTFPRSPRSATPACPMPAIPPPRPVSTISPVRRRHSTPRRRSA